MSKSSPNTHAPRVHSSLSLRSRKFFRIWNVPPDPSTLNGEKSVPSIEVQGEIVSTQWSANGAIFAVTFQDQGLVLYTLKEPEVSSGLETLQLRPFPLPLPEQLQNLPAKQLKWIVFSPQGTYLCTYWIPNGLGLAELTGPNYYIWRITRSEDGAISRVNIVFSDTYKTLSSPGPMQWRDDEQIRVFTRNGSLHICSGHDFEKPALAVLSLAPRFSISIAPFCASDSDALSITMFAPASQAGDIPGEVRFLLCKITRREKDEAGLLHARAVTPVKIGVKELSGVDGCDFMWSPSGRICMMMTSTLVDAAGDNYGSVGDLWLCDLQDAWKKSSAEGTVEDERLSSVKENMGMQQSGSAVDIEYLQIKKINERVTQDAKWSPTADEFVLIEGKAPSDIYLYDGVTGERVYTFAKGYKNQIVWNRQGDMVAIGGFGNLAGDLSFYYRDPNRQVTLINEWRESCTVLCDWSPCGNYFFTASIRPRMNVDNQIKLWSREGAQLLHIPFDELNGVEWRQAPGVDFPVPPVPKPAERMQNKTTYRPRNWANTSADSQLMTRYYNGEITENDLPEELRKRIASRSTRNNGARGFSEKGRYGATDKACDTVMDWRSSEPVSEEKKDISEGAQSEVTAPSGAAVQGSQASTVATSSSKSSDGKRGAAAEDPATNAAVASKKEPVSRKARKEQSRPQQSTSHQAATISVGNKKASTVLAEKGAKGAAVPAQTDQVGFEESDVIKKQASAATTADTTIIAPRDTTAPMETQREAGAGPPSPESLDNKREARLDPPRVNINSEIKVPQIPVTLPANVSALSQMSASTAHYGDGTSSGVSLVPNVQIPTQYNMPQPVAAASAKQVPAAPESMLSYLPQPFPVYSSNRGDTMVKEPVVTGLSSAGNTYPKYETNQLSQSDVSRMTSHYVTPPAATVNMSTIIKDQSSRQLPSYHTKVPIMAAQQPRPYDGGVMDARLPPVVDKMYVQAPPCQQQQPSPALSDNSILSLLQSILPSHAKLHVRAEPEGLVGPTTSSSAGTSATSSADGASAFLRYFDKSAQGSSPPYAFRPQSKMSNRAPGQTPGQATQQSYSGAPPPAFPNPRLKDASTDKERELEQARFIALIEQAGLKLPNLTFTSSRPAATTTAPPASNPYSNPAPQSRQRQRWPGQPPLSPRAGSLMNSSQEAQKSKLHVSANEQFWPTIQDVFTTKELNNDSSAGWGVKSQAPQDSKRRAGGYQVSAASGVPAINQRYDDGGVRPGMIGTNDAGNLEMDTNLRELLRSLQCQTSQQNSAEYAVKELLQNSVNARSSQQHYLEHHQQVEVVESRKRVQAGWSQDLGNVRRIHGQSAQPSAPLNIEPKHKSGYDTIPSGGHRRVWQYVDPKGVVQGPFSRREMRAWWEKGYFAGDLPVRCDMQEDFVPLQEMFPGGEKVFAEE